MQVVYNCDELLKY